MYECVVMHDVQCNTYVCMLMCILCARSVLYLPRGPIIVTYAVHCRALHSDSTIGDEGGMAATIGIFLEFDPSRGLFTAFVKRVQFFLSANEVKEDKYTAVLLNAVGKETYVLLRNLLAPSLPKEKLFEEIVQALQAHLEPRPLVIESVDRSGYAPRLHGHACLVCHAGERAYTPWPGLAAEDPIRLAQPWGGLFG